MNFSCVLILGPTASGKTSLAHTLSEQFSLQNKECEIVNLDAFQIYKELNIGTAKPTPDEILKYNYHGVDVCNLHENLDANTFATMARSYCKNIWARNKLPICVGGSGLYLRSFLHGLDNLPVRDENIRAQIKLVAQEHGWPYCHDWLRQVDPLRAQELHPNDKVRIERALEIFLLTGKPQSANRSKESILKEQTTLFPCYVIHCRPPSEELKQKIHMRVEQLFKMGWQSEVKQLFEKYGNQLQQFHAMQAIGYKQILNHLHDPQVNLMQKISTLTWQYAKKQLTWCAKEKMDFVVNSSVNYEELVCEIKKFDP